MTTFIGGRHKANGKWTTTDVDPDVVALEKRVAALEAAQPGPPPDPTPDPPPATTGIARSGWADTKDNIQIHQGGNGNVAIQLVKHGTGPISGVRLQMRTGPVYSAGDGGSYSVAAVLGSPDGMVIASVLAFKPGTNGGKADAIFPEITFTSPSVDVPDGTRFWIRLLNTGTNPDANYTSLNVLYIYGGWPTPRQPGIPDADLAVLVNTGGGWTDHKRTPNVDVLPGHEGFGYTQCLTGYWKPFGGAAQVRETFTIDSPITFTKISVRVRRTSGTSAGIVTVGPFSGSFPAASIPATAPGGDNAGQTIVTLQTPGHLDPGTYRLVLTSAADTTYTATPVRKPLAGSYPTLTKDWGSFTTNGYAEYSSDAGATWHSFYGSPNQTDLQFELA